MSNLRLDHIPLLEGVQNYREWSKVVKYTLLGEDLWKYVSKGTNQLDLVNYGIPTPDDITSKSSEKDIEKAREFIVHDAKANAIIRCRLAPLISANIPYKHDNSARGTWTYLSEMYDRVDPAAQFTLRAHISTLRLKDATDVERFIGEFNTA
jgi:gag-polypeptide of LTR copia-type